MVGFKILCKQQVNARSARELEQQHEAEERPLLVHRAVDFAWVI